MGKTKITYIFVFCGRPPVTKSRVVTYTIHRDLLFRKKRIQSVIFELTLLEDLVISQVYRLVEVDDLAFRMMRSKIFGADQGYSV